MLIIRRSKIYVFNLLMKLHLKAVIIFALIAHVRKAKQG